MALGIVVVKSFPNVLISKAGRLMWLLPWIAVESISTVLISKAGRLVWPVLWITVKSISNVLVSKTRRLVRLAPWFIVDFVSSVLVPGVEIALRIRVPNVAVSFSGVPGVGATNVGVSAHWENGG